MATIEQPTPAAPSRRLGGQRAWWSPSRLIAVHGLLLLLFAFCIFFSLLQPDTFPTAFNARSILATKSVTALLALAVMVPLVAGQFDLSVGYGLGLTHTLVVGLQIKSGVSWEVASVVAIAAGCTIGLTNGLLVAFVRIDSFIATLATGTFVFGLANWYTNGEQIAGTLPSAFSDAVTTTIFGFVPMPAIYVLAIATILWLILEYLPVGRHLYALGGNARAAELVGIRPNRNVIGSFVASGFLVGIAGVILGAQLQAGSSALGPEFLLPAFVGALLGATSVRPGRVNVWGTLIAVLLLSVGIAGLQQLGAKFFVEPLFNAATLTVAVGVAGYAARRRLQARGKASGEPGETEG